MKVTIRDVAKQAGVSAASVSLVLNDRPSRITEQTKDKIHQVAKEMGYSKVEKKNLSKAETHKIIGVIHPDLNNVLANECMLGIHNYASIYGYKIIICDVENSTQHCLEYIEMMPEIGASGIIMIPPMDMNTDGNDRLIGEMLKKVKLPFILLDRAVNRVFCDFITSDNKQGAYMACEYLISCGHEKIGMVAGLKEVYNTRKRVEGYKEALAFYNIPLVTEYIYYGDYSAQSGYEAAAYFWEKGLTAIFSSNDEMAMGVYQYAKEHHIEIGEELSIVGFDNMPICQRVTPTLTSVSQSGELMGKKACEMIIKRITKEKEEEIRNTYFAPRLIERDSVKRFRKEIPQRDDSE